METIGLTTTADPVSAPGFHVYVLAPPPLSVEDKPEQIDAGLADTVRFGEGFTEIFLTAVAVQPAAEAPVTV